jgi:methionyl-tRNA synthetase
MVGKYFDASIPAPGATGEVEIPVLAAAKALADEAPGALAGCQFHVYLDRIMDLAGATNRYIDVTSPFKLAKDPSQKDRLATILYVCSEAVRLVLLYLGPVMPEISARGLAQLGYFAPADAIRSAGSWGILPPGTKTAKGEGLFPRKDA